MRQLAGLLLNDKLKNLAYIYIDPMQTLYNINCTKNIRSVCSTHVNMVHSWVLWTDLIHFLNFIIATNVFAMLLDIC